MSVETILVALDRHAGLFDLSGQLGEDLLDVATLGVFRTFAAQSDPDGNPWPALTTEYARAKARLFPGKPMGIATEEMSEGLPGERAQSADEARYTFGETGPQKQKAVWFQARRKFVGLTEESTSRSREVLSRHLTENL